MLQIRRCLRSRLRESPSLGRSFNRIQNEKVLIQRATCVEEYHHCTYYNRQESRQNYKFFSTNASGVMHNVKQFDTLDKTPQNDTDNESTNEEEGFLVSKYRSKANESNVMLDEHQIDALKELDRLRDEILASPTFKNEAKVSIDSIGDGEENSYSFFSFNVRVPTFSNFLTVDSVQSSRGAGKGLKGVYLHGGVGCGKTFCMDLFFDYLPIASKQKVHFHKFILDVHKQMHEAKMVNGVEGDVLPSVVDRIIEKGLVICFDEFQVRACNALSCIHHISNYYIIDAKLVVPYEHQVTDVADALILRRLFTGILNKGAIIVATSNRPPSDLYLNGLQRDLFLPFIDLLVEKSKVISMWESETDYRVVQGVNKARGVYFIGGGAKADFDESFKELTKGSPITDSSKLSTQGRNIDIPRASLEYGVARFSFDDLCRRARGAADYLIIGENFHTVFVEDVPALSMNDINLVRRFIVFVDAMYECHVKLILHAATKPDKIFKVDLDNTHCDEAFAFDRTRSRLQEMGSDEYLKSRWNGKIDRK
jgi:predicted ATPase